SKAAWKPVTEDIIFVYPDQPAKRRDYEEQVVQTFYLSNTVQAQDLTEIVTGLRQLLELKRISQVNSQNAIIIRDTPDKLALAKKMIDDIDKARPEVVVQVSVLDARTACETLAYSRGRRPLWPSRRKGPAQPQQLRMAPPPRRRIPSLSISWA